MPAMDDDKFDEPTIVEKTSLLDKADVFEYDKISERERDILESCSRRDLDKLRCIAESPGGFVTDRLRQSACKYISHSIYTLTHPWTQIMSFL